VSLTVLLGGARAGKSALALELAHGQGLPVVYVVTAEAGDDEMTERIAQHRAERPDGWRTVEEPVALRSVLASVEPHACVVVDCLTLWVANLLARGDDVLPEAEAVAELAAARSGSTIVVSNEVGLGIVPASPVAREYRDLLGAVNAAFVRRAEDAAFVVSGCAIPLQPGWQPGA
jgi:adenosyl cobinamide kinase/adenosyl cobinamide phosphate guanylyltransferase